MNKDTYMAAKVTEYPNATVRVFRPILTQEERDRRMKAVYKAAEDVLKEVERKQCLQQ